MNWAAVAGVLLVLGLIIFTLFVIFLAAEFQAHFQREEYYKAFDYQNADKHRIKFEKSQGIFTDDDN